ncbi:MAG: N-acetyl sugar amidotransferase [Alphaproteobacteria bacterium]|nr:N-acetyl sugar amidotransferase [Alphaproteobacteria bacterium]
MSNLRLCTRCVMPETAESLTFDTQGVCSVCKQIEVKQTTVDWAARGAEFSMIVDKVRGRHDYDCIVPFSGGKDSTYTLWHLVKERGLKPLVVRFDHGFMRQNLQENVLRTLRILGCDAVTFTPNWQVVRKLMFESLKRRGDFCWHCHTGIFAYPMWVALEKCVPLVIWGEPSSEYSSFYSYEDDEEVDERRFNAFVNLGINAEDMLGMLDNSISSYPVTPRDLKPYTYPPAVEIRKGKIRSVCLGSYQPWDVKEQTKIIERELGWKGDEVEGVPPEYSYEKIECFMQGVRDYLKFLKRGFGRTSHLVSIDIRNNRKTRAEALDLVERYDGKKPYALELFLSYLGIDEPTFYNLVKMHVVAPHSMPPQSDLMQSVSDWKPADAARWPRISGDRDWDVG